jgi:MscS family membrane protein
MSILDNTYYGNGVMEWMVAAFIIIGAIILSKVIYWIIGKVIKAFTRKTKTKLDDIMVDMVEEPISVYLVLVGIWYAIQFLTFTPAVETWINGGFTFVIFMNTAWLITRVYDAVHEEYFVAMTKKTESTLDDELLPILKKGIKSTVWIVAIIVGLNNAGYNVGALLAGLGIGGLALAMAAKDTISNIFGGLMIFSERPFQINDRIQVDGIDGIVHEIGIRSTRIRTLAGRLVLIPNSRFINSPVENVTSEPSRKIVLKLGLTYDTKPKNMELAIKLLKGITKKNKNLEEKVLVSFNEFGDFAMGIMLIYYIKKDSDILDTQSEINLEILKQFNENKLEFAFPTQTIYTAK